MQFELKYIINVIVIFLLVSFSIFLFTQKNEHHCRLRMLAVFLLCIAIPFIGDVFDHFKQYFYTHFPHVFYIDFPFPYMYPPLLYLITRSFVSKDFRINTHQLYHFVPFVFALLLILFRYHIYDADTKRTILESGPIYDPVFGPSEGNYYSLVFYIQFFSYAIASLLAIRNYQKEVKHYFSSLDRIDLTWLKIVILGLLLWNLINGTHQLIWMITATHYSIIIILAKVLILFLASILVFKGIRQPEVFLGLITNNNSKKYEKSLLPASEKERYLHKLLNYMESEKPYLDPAISLNSLAQQVSISTHHLSQIINDCLKQNYFDFINSYRIKESQRLLMQPSKEKKTILEILYETGFNSKSVFNTSFKKYTGMTPTEYRNSNSVS